MSRRSLAGTSGIHPVRAELKTPHGKEGLAQTRSNAGPIRVRAEIPSVTRKRAFLNQVQKYIVIRRVRNKDPGRADVYRRQSLELAEHTMS